MKWIISWAHFRRYAPETGLFGVPLRSIRCVMRNERYAPLQSLARLASLVAKPKFSLVKFKK
jgi:hypothetical protein